jgi:GNAT superfamily N-acetyltransferase
MPDQGPVFVRRADIESAEASALTDALAAEVAARYDDHAPPVPVTGEETAPGRGLFVIAALDGADAGCGALRRMPDAGFEDAGELKRMYVRPEARRRGVARAVLAALGRKRVSSD